MISRVRFLLAHSPLVGPGTWRPTAEALISAGHEVDVPDLTEAAATGDPEEVIRGACPSAGPGPSAIVGHSGAGTFLPSIADRIGWPARGLLFVDAGLPPCQGVATVGGDFLGQLREMAVDGILPQWSTWWRGGVMEALVPNGALRAEIEDEMPQVPLALYESTLTVPSGWCDMPGAFLLLSEAYRHEAARARALGWPVGEELGGHLDLVNRPREVAQDLIGLALGDT